MASVLEGQRNADAKAPLNGKQLICVQTLL